MRPPSVKMPMKVQAPCRTVAPSSRRERLLPELFEIAGGSVDERGLADKRFRHADDLRFRLGVLLLLDPLAHARHRLHRVTGVEAWGVEQMAIPRTTGQA